MTQAQPTDEQGAGPGSGPPPLLQYLCFDTAIGLCGLAWSSQGLVGSQLPEATRGETRDRMRQRFPAAVKAREGEAVPAFVEEAIACVRALAAGQPAQVAHVVLDERDLTPFQRALFTRARQIPQGQTRSYGDLAALLKMPGGARAVGQAMGLNPFAPIVPCHRVLPAAGSKAGLGGFSAHGGAVTKARLLALEARATGQWVGQQSSLDLDHF
ncbi:methylated-DNA--[protein]-cysteine S-methyltransferase [Pelomonas sp. APW6]|uniref:Methylated-DNA--[protein]-cysteine S-methyltransferase n=1 Tax=Roseateles subflavus TaxID=3053353 RepID=A0ABT7LKF6_9BURK|nr:methylated-DNA--[protein]-cysteine S-methyltransferase [Pelomonas sp. APW6]MDL5033347.1 methylated-DNA--[protein]-cysteine S-methyltransferase [Pelomonas sp. APW6]